MLKGAYVLSKGLCAKIPPFFKLLKFLNRYASPYDDRFNLRVNIGQINPHIEWVAVRPDNLINEENVTEYSLHTSPIRSALFNPGKTSRINVGHFMTRLITDDIIWNKWKGQMPVIYNDTN